MDELSKFSHQITFLYTPDIEATTRFYGDLLEFPIVLHQLNCRIFKTSPGGYLGFCTHLEPPRNSKEIIIAFVTEDVDGWYQKLIASGSRCEKEPAINPIYHIYHCFFRDSAGYLVEIQRFLAPFDEENHG